MKLSSFCGHSVSLKVLFFVNSSRVNGIYGLKITRMKSRRPVWGLIHRLLSTVHQTYHVSKVSHSLKKKLYANRWSRPECISMFWVNIRGPQTWLWSNSFTTWPLQRNKAPAKKFGYFFLWKKCYTLAAVNEIQSRGKRSVSCLCNTRRLHSSITLLIESLWRRVDRVLCYHYPASSSGRRSLTISLSRLNDSFTDISSVCGRFILFHIPGLRNLNEF